MLAISLRPGITRNPKHLLPGTSLSFEERQEHKWRREKRLQSGQSKFTPSGSKIKTFLEGKEDWLKEGLLVPVKKNKRGRIIGEGSSMAQEGGAQQNYVPPFGEIPAPPSYYGGVPMQAWGSGAAIPPPSFAVPNVALAEPYAHLPLPQQSVAIIGGYAARNMQNIAAILTNANQMGEEMQTSLMSFDAFT
jgi:hypothetical protein